MSISGNICLFRRFITRLLLIDGKLSEEQVVIKMLLLLRDGKEALWEPGDPMEWIPGFSKAR